MVKRINTTDVVKVVDNNSPHFNETGNVKETAKGPVLGRLRNHLLVELHNSGVKEYFLLEQLEVIGKQ